MKAMKYIRYGLAVAAGLVLCLNVPSAFAANSNVSVITNNANANSASERKNRARKHAASQSNMKVEKRRTGRMDGVRAHTGRNANAPSRELGGRAYSHGRRTQQHRLDTIGD